MADGGTEEVGVWEAPTLLESGMVEGGWFTSVVDRGLVEGALCGVDNFFGFRGAFVFPFFPLSFTGTSVPPPFSSPTSGFCSNNDSCGLS
jgi:hypothetical protein